MAFIDERAEKLKRERMGMPREEGAVSNRERLDALRAREAELYDSARNRRLNSLATVAAAEPGRYAPSVTAWARDRIEKQNLRAHEMEMLKQQGANARGVEEARANGIVGAADKTGYWANETERSKLGGLTEQERIRAESAQNVEKTRQEGLTNQETIRAQSAEKVANINADSAYAVEDRRQAGEKAVEVEKGAAARDVAKTNAEASAQVEAIKLQNEKEIATLRARYNVSPTNEDIMAWEKAKKDPAWRGKTFVDFIKDVRGIK